jgi:Protein of unknown function (DUF2845)
MQRFKTIFWAALFVVLVAFPAAAGNMRCGNDFVKIGDRAYMVSKKCGEPVSKQFIGYTINADGKRELAIEDWIYGPINSYIYFIRFIGGEVSEITSEQQ